MHRAEGCAARLGTATVKETFVDAGKYRGRDFRSGIKDFPRLSRDTCTQRWGAGGGGGRGGFEGNFEYVFTVAGFAYVPADAETEARLGTYGIHQYKQTNGGIRGNGESKFRFRGSSSLPRRVPLFLSLGAVRQRAFVARGCRRWNFGGNGWSFGKWSGGEDAVVGAFFGDCTWMYWLGDGSGTVNSRCITTRDRAESCNLQRLDSRRG